MSDDLVYVDLTFRVGNVRVSASNAVSIKSIKEFRDNGYEGIVNATVAGLNAKLRPHVETMIAESESRPSGR